jgi:hypothetical protein
VEITALSTWGPSGLVERSDARGDIWNQNDQQGNVAIPSGSDDATGHGGRPLLTTTGHALDIGGYRGHSSDDFLPSLAKAPYARGKSAIFTVGAIYSHPTVISGRRLCITRPLGTLG